MRLERMILQLERAASELKLPSPNFSGHWWASHQWRGNIDHRMRAVIQLPLPPGRRERAGVRGPLFSR